MKYTVKKIAKLSGVSIRTLHYYDEIGLLKPAYVSEVGYRYYDEEQLLLLQQIMFFKELGLELKEIQKILLDPDFDKLAALRSHRQALEEKIENTETLLATIDKTVRHLERKKIMEEQELFWGFSKEQQEEYEEYLVEQYGKEAEGRIDESYRNIRDWKKEDWQDVQKEFDTIHRTMTEALEKNLNADHVTMQEIVQKHFKLISKFYNPTKEVYTGLGQLYTNHPDFRRLYDSYHPQLADYMAQAMKFFANRELA
jgi:DNA-binding transcriptional MerR regulator